MNLIHDEGNVCNVSVKYIRPKYDNLIEWLDDDNNIYIGRNGRVPIGKKIDKKTFHFKSSIWHNPFRIQNNDRTSCIDKYEKYILEKIENEPKKYDLNKLVGKNLGCWCKPKQCHGDVLIKIMKDKKII